MLEIVTIEQLMDTDIVPKTVYEELEIIKKRIIEGEKIVIKKKTSKSGIYLNIYVYDKTSWRYLLNKSIKLE